jgi:hypothetical protein
MKLLILMALTSLVMTGCASKEYYEVRRQCSKEAQIEIPPDIQQITVQRTRQIKYVTDTICDSFVDYNGYVRTSCTPIYGYQSIPYSTEENVDLSKKKRNDWRKSCVTKQCISKYGNADCDTEKK